jgi:hypothetical protein
MKHETEIYDGEPFNFEKVSSRYLKFANQNSGISSVQKPVIMKAFEHIKVSLQIIHVYAFILYKLFYISKIIVYRIWN